MSEDTPLLSRIADALERLAPPPAAPIDLDAHPAYRWDGHSLAPIEGFAPIDYALLTGIDAQKTACLDNSRVRDEFGYVPEYDLEKGLAALAAWVKDGSYL